MSNVEIINLASMNMILSAGNARELYNQSMDCVENGDFTEGERLLARAEKEITEAHKLQTRLLQEAIEEEHPTITVLMVHAQDTIMAVDSEIRLIRRLQKLYRNLACGKEEEG